MSGSFVVDLATLQDATSRMSVFERTVDTALADVERTIRGLQETWTGAAAHEHLRAHREWLAGARAMHEAAAAMRAIATTAHGNYSAAVAANRRMWG